MDKKRERWAWMISMMQIWVLSKVPLLTHDTPKKYLAVLSRKIKIKQFIFFL